MWSVDVPQTDVMASFCLLPTAWKQQIMGQQSFWFLRNKEIIFIQILLKFDTIGCNLSYKKKLGFQDRKHDVYGRLNVISSKKLYFQLVPVYVGPR